MAEVNGQNVEKLIAIALRDTLREDGFVASELSGDYGSFVFTVLRNDEDEDGKGVTIGARIIVQPVVMNPGF